MQTKPRGRINRTLVDPRWTWAWDRLVFALLLEQGGGYLDLLRGVAAPTGACTIVPGPYGPKLVVPTADNTELRYGTDTLKFQSNRMTTIVMAAAPKGWVSQDGLVGWRDVGNADTLWRFRNDTVTNRMLYQHFYDDTSSFSASSLTQAWMFDGRIFIVAGISNVTTLEIHGAEPFTVANYFTNSNTGSAVKSSETAPLAIGKDRVSDSVGGGWDGDIHMVLRWKDRVLTTQEILAIFRAPFDMFRPAHRPRGFVPTGQAAGPTVSTTLELIADFV